MQIIPKNILTTKSNTNDYTLNYVIEPINKDNKTWIQGENTKVRKQRHARNIQ